MSKPALALQVAVWQVTLGHAVDTHREVPRHVPAMHLSSTVAASPSSHDIPSAAGTGAAHSPATQGPGARHCSWVRQTTLKHASGSQVPLTAVNPRAQRQANWVEPISWHTVLGSLQVAVRQAPPTENAARANWPLALLLSEATMKKRTAGARAAAGNVTTRFPSPLYRLKEPDDKI